MIGLSPCAMALLSISGLHGAVAVATVSWLQVQNGSSVTLPCHYPSLDRHRAKFWCWGFFWSSCRVLARSDSPAEGGKVTIADHPDSGVFTVTLRDLQRGDTAFYWCAVEGGSSASLYLSVTNGVPNLMVEDNMVVGAEGGSVSIRCFYSNLTRDGMRKWCRSGDWGSCLTLDSPLAERSPLITDNGEGAFGVRMRRLQRSDEGWYWCVAGDLQAPVHIAVLQDPNNTLIATTKNHTTEESSTVFYSSTATVHKTNRPGQGSQLCSGAQTCLRRTLWVLRHTGLVLVFLICTAVAFWKIWQNRRVLQSRENRRCGTKLRCQNNTDCL